MAIVPVRNLDLVVPLANMATDKRITETSGLVTQDRSGAVSSLIGRIEARKKSHKVHTLALICNERGAKLGIAALRDRFDKARTHAAKSHPTLADAISAFQFRDLRAKAGTDKADSGGMREAQLQLGHNSMQMTEHYVRGRRGEKVSPTK